VDKLEAMRVFSEVVSHGGFTAAARDSLRVESSRLLDLALAEDADPVAPGEQLTYQLSFGNRTGSTLASAVVLRLPVPAGASPAATATAVPLDEPPGTR